MGCPESYDVSCGNEVDLNLILAERDIGDESGWKQKKFPWVVDGQEIEYAFWGPQKKAGFEKSQ